MSSKRRDERVNKEGGHKKTRKDNGPRTLPDQQLRRQIFLNRLLPLQQLLHFGAVARDVAPRGDDDEVAGCEGPE
jgi:hypothetical protein